MKISLETVYNGFFFLEDLSLVKGKPATEVDLSDKSDSFIKTIAIGVSIGTLRSNVGVKQIINLIQNKRIRLELLSSLLGETIEEELSITETVTAEVEIVESIQEDIPSTEDEDQDEPVDPFAEILDGSNKTVIAKIKNACLTEEQKSKLIELEVANRNRVAILNAIKEV